MVSVRHTEVLFSMQNMGKNFWIQYSFLLSGRALAYSINVGAKCLRGSLLKKLAGRLHKNIINFCVLFHTFACAAACAHTCTFDGR